MGQMTMLSMLLRLLTAMAVGMLVGGQRARSAHPAGLRTHMLVALGAAIVMMTSCVLFFQTNTTYGSSPDPARLGAQVVNGIGFLGAGTIIKDGLSVRGLTTAASLWAVACLGLAAGMGYYHLALLGGAAIYITLVAFDRIQQKLRTDGKPEIDLQIECEHASELMVKVDEMNKRLFAQLCDLSINHTPHDTYLVSFRIIFPKLGWESAEARFTQAIGALPGIISMENHRDL